MSTPSTPLSFSLTISITGSIDSALAEQNTAVRLARANAPQGIDPETILDALHDIAGVLKAKYEADAAAVEAEVDNDTSTEPEAS